MNASDYLSGAEVNGACMALSGDPVATPWDPQLSETMRATGRAVYEETVADQLLTDLTEYSTGSGPGRPAAALYQAGSQRQPSSSSQMIFSPSAVRPVIP
jgi:hypothetical protein